MQWFDEWWGESQPARGQQSLFGLIQASVYTNNPHALLIGTVISTVIGAASTVIVTSSADER